MRHERLRQPRRGPTETKREIGPHTEEVRGPIFPAILAEVVHHYSNFEWTLPTLRKTRDLLNRAPQRIEAKSSEYVPHKLPQRLSEERLEQIVAEYVAGGVSTVKLGQRHGISDSTVRSLLHSRGIDTPQRKLSEADVDEVVALYAQGHFMKAIGEQFGVDRGTVRNALLRRDVT